MQSTNPHTAPIDTPQQRRLLIKVCGMRDADNIQQVAQLDIDLMGFVFYPQSPRFVKMISSNTGLIPDYSEERLRNANANKQAPIASAKEPQRVGVFVDEMPQTIVTRIYNHRLQYVQLHGEESPTMIDNLKRTLIPDIAPNIKVIKALSVASKEDVARYKDYEGLVDLFLFDTRSCSAVALAPTTPNGCASSTTPCWPASTSIAASRRNRGARMWISSERSSNK